METPTKSSWTINSPLCSTEGPFLIFRDRRSSKALYTNKCEWEMKENIRFAAFMLAYSETIQSKQAQERWPIFILASKYIRTRSTCQCRNYYVRIKQQFIETAHFAHYCNSIYPHFQSYLNEYQQELFEFLQAEERGAENYLDNSPLQSQQMADQKQGGEDRAQTKPQEAITMPRFFMDYFYPGAQKSHDSPF